MTNNIYDLTIEVFFYIKKKRFTSTERICSRYNQIRKIETREFNFQNLKRKKFAGYNLRINRILREEVVGTWEGIAKQEIES